MGTIHIDDTGVAGKRRWRRTSFTWDEIDDYRLEVSHVGGATPIAGGTGSASRSS